MSLIMLTPFYLFMNNYFKAYRHLTRAFVPGLPPAMADVSLGAE